MNAETTNDEKSNAKDSSSAAKEFDWFDRPESRRLLWRLLYGACIVAILLEIVLIVTHQRHSHFGGHGGHEAGDAVHGEPAVAASAESAYHGPTFDGWWFFYAGLGFVGCALMILSAKGLGYLLKKPTDYYGDDTLAKDEPLPEDIDEVLR